MGSANYEQLHSNIYRNCRPNHLAATPMQKRGF